MTTLIEIVTAILLVGGGLLALTGSYGLLRLKGPMQRLHAPAKATTIGTGTALVAVAAHIWLVQDRLALREVLVAVFFFATAPLSALFLAKAHLFRTLPNTDLPPTGTGTDWAVLTGDPTGDGPANPDQTVKFGPATPLPAAPRPCHPSPARPGQRRPCFADPDQDRSRGRPAADHRPSGPPPQPGDGA